MKKKARTKNSKRRFLAVVLSLSMIISLFTGIAVSADTSNTDGSSNAFKDLYIREADKNTMDSYVQASLGGYVYTNGTPFIFYNDGSRYAGEVWADLSVFAHYQEVAGNGYNRDGDFDGETLILGKYTDGVNSSVTMNGSADFLNVFSVLGSSQQIAGETPIDLVMVLDVSGSMGNPDLDNSKIYQSVMAMNETIHTLMTMNTSNRVGVVLFASYPIVLMELAHYTPISGTRTIKSNNYIQIDKSFVYSNQDGNANVNSNTDWYVYDISAVQATGGTITHVYSGVTRTGNAANYGGDGNGNNSYIGSNTNIDGGMWLGLKQLANATGTIETVNGKTVSHIPAFIFLGDGTPQIEMTWSGGNWWEPNTGDITNEGMFVDIPIVLSTIMHTAFMKAAVTNTYTSAAKKADAENQSDLALSFFTIGIEMGQADLGDYSRKGAQALMDPGNPTEGFNSSNSSFVHSTYTVQKAYELWEQWASGSSPVNAGSRVSGSPYNNQARTFNQLGTNPWNVTKQQVIDNIYYTDQYFDATSASSVSTTLAELVERLSTPAFRPVEGSNASYVQDSLTYSNPIGEYMAVSNVTDVTMFGEHYKVERYAVYDYLTNKAIRGGKSQITEGWYDKDNNLVAEKGSLPSGCIDNEAAWEKGYTYRINFTEAIKLVPTLKDEHITNPDSLPIDMKNTVYTVYRITAIHGKNSNGTISTNTTPISETNRMRDNLSYAVGNDDASKVTFDLWDDIRIWVEDTGDYKASGGSVVDSNFSEALFINISTSALPVQVATVTVQSQNGNSAVPKEYTTNLTNTSASTPLRVYYNVSLDPDYLRHDSEGNPVGVAMSDISAEYSKNNTADYYLGADGFYNKFDDLANTDKADTDKTGRYTAFYTNYFSDSKYENYPVTMGDSDTSRGDSVVTFAVSPENQFYRFQKDRVLLLIPGSYGLKDRPAEIDLTGYLTGSDTEPTIEELRVVLNTAREAKNTPYYAFGDCILVDGGDNVDDYSATFDQRTASLSEDGKAAAKARYDTFAENLKKAGLTYQPQISPDNWYYIIREYYAPNADGSVTVHYAAIARKGSEFGSGIAGGGTDNMGAMVEWYNPTLDEENTKPFDPTKDHYGYPGEGTDIKEIEGGHEHTGNWYVAAKPGGLRVGGMSNFIGTKGYDIREGVDETGFTKDPGVIEAANVTGRAQTYFLPTVYDFNVAYANTGKINAVIALYLGNNGRILVDQTLLLVTKLVDGRNNAYDLDSTEPFTIYVSIEGFSGTRGAVKVIWDNDAQKWRRTIGSIDAVTNNDGLLLQNGSEKPATVDSTGKFDLKGGFYVYIHDADGKGSARVYACEETDGEMKVTKGVRKESSTEIKFLVDEVYLIPVDKYKAGWSFSESYNKITATADGSTGFLIATMDPNNDKNTVEGNADISLTSEFFIRAGYLAKDDIVFEYKGVNTQDGKAMGTAEITLKSGEGLLFNTIANGAEYSVSEILSDEQVSGGWQFKSVNGKAESSTENGYDYSINDTKHTYTVSGNTGTYEAVVSYINVQKLTGLTVYKEVKAGTGTTVTKEDRDRAFEFTIKLTDSNGDALTGPFSYTIYKPGEVPENPDPEAPAPPDQFQSGHLTMGNDKDSHVGHKDGDLDIGTNTAGTWTFDLKDGWYINFSLPDKVTYTVTEIPTEHYQADFVEKSGTITEANQEEEVTVTFVNTKQAPSPVTVSLTAFKEVTGDGAPGLEADKYSFTITPADGNPAGDPITSELTVQNAADNADGTTDLKALITLFSNVEYKSAGTYIYTVKEVEPADKDKIPGIYYDDTEYTVTVKIEDDYDKDNFYTGKLKATVTVDGTVVVGTQPDPNENSWTYAITGGKSSFENTFSRDAIAELRGTKVLDATPTGSATLSEGQFTFELIAGTATYLEDTATGTSPLPKGVTGNSITIPNGADGKFSFGEITFTKPGTYEYTIQEVVPDVKASGITYDGRTYSVTVTVTPDETTGILVPKVEYEIDGKSANAVVFTNYYNEPVDLTISKTVTGSEGDTTKEFSFTVTLTPPTGVTLESSYNYTGGNIEGVERPEDGTLELTKNKDGTYSCEIELKHGQSITIHDLPAGTIYTVTEASEDGYSTKVRVNGTADRSAENKKLLEDTEVAFTNSWKSGDLTVTKTVTGNAGDTTKAFDFTVTLTPPAGTTLENSYYYTGGGIEGVEPPEDGILELTDNKDGTYSGTITLKHGQSVTIEGLPGGTAYKVTETGADGYTTTSTGAEGTIPEDGSAVTAAFTNSKTSGGGTTPDKHYGSLTVSKTVTGDAGDHDKEFHFTVTLSDKSINGTYGEMTFIDGVAAFTLKDGENKTATGLPAGIAYTVTETEADQDGYTTTAAGETGSIPTNRTATAAFVNNKTETPSDPDTGSLTVIKTVTGDAGDHDKEFHFTVTLSDKSINGTYGEMSFTDGVATFTLKDGESKTATGLPGEIFYTVTEAEADQDGYTTTAAGETGTISAGGTATAAFVNDKSETPPDPDTGGLTVSKTVAGNAGEQSKAFHFTVTLDDSEINGTYGDMTFVNGVASFTLTHDQSLTAAGLPADIAYWVTEAEAGLDGYVTTASGSTGTIPGNGTAVASFTNTKDDVTESDQGNLIVNKIVGGDLGEKGKGFLFAVELSDKTINGTYGDMTFVNGVAIFTLKHGESKIATGLPSGITYSVMEQQANQDGYFTASKGRNGTIPSQGTAQASFFNTKGEPLPDDPPLEEFDDPDIPLSGFPEFPDIPETGDNSHPKLWPILTVLSAIGLLLVGFFPDEKRDLSSAKGKRISK